MFKGIDHVVIAVRDLEASIGQYEAMLGVPVSDRFENEAAGMQMAYFRFPESYVELVAPLGDDGPIAKRLANQGEGVHLLAMKVETVDETVTTLRDKGIRMIGDPGEGNTVRGQVFVHPSVTGGVLTQLVGE